MVKVILIRTIWEIFWLRLKPGQENQNMLFNSYYSAVLSCNIYSCTFYFLVKMLLVELKNLTLISMLEAKLLHNKT